MIKSLIPFQDTVQDNSLILQRLNECILKAVSILFVNETTYVHKVKRA